ncbi:hypothetical protein C8R45DRAFT_1193408 [Mycena sanguinolenta]|nr:hypothetical protein C8R45DRAFT_1193408 [Mycena sanguinolenta]
MQLSCRTAASAGVSARAAAHTGRRRRRTTANGDETGARTSEEAGRTLEQAEKKRGVEMGSGKREELGSGKGKRKREAGKGAQQTGSGKRKEAQTGRCGRRETGRCGRSDERVRSGAGLAHLAPPRNERRRTKGAPPAQTALDIAHINLVERIAHGVSTPRARPTFEKRNGTKLKWSLSLGQDATRRLGQRFISGSRAPRGRNETRRTVLRLQPPGVRKDGQCSNGKQRVVEENSEWRRTKVSTAAAVTTTHPNSNTRPNGTPPLLPVLDAAPVQDGAELLTAGYRRRNPNRPENRQTTADVEDKAKAAGRRDAARARRCGGQASGRGGRGVPRGNGEGTRYLKTNSSKIPQLDRNGNAPAPHIARNTLFTALPSSNTNTLPRWR